MRLSAAAYIAALCLWLALPAAADNLADFRAALEQASAQYRTAARALETSGPEATALEVERFRAAWQAIADRFGANRPPMFRDDPQYTATLLDMDVRIVGALIVINAGRQDAARSALAGIGDVLTQFEARAAAPQ